MSKITKDELIEQIKDGIIVSCPSPPSWTALYRSRRSFLSWSKTAEQGGAVGIRANSVRDIKEIKGSNQVADHWDYQTRLPTWRTLYHGYYEEVDELAALDIAVIALGCTKRPASWWVLISDFIHQVKKISDQLLMADISTLEEGLTAVQAGVDFVRTTLSGYTNYSPRLMVQILTWFIVSAKQG